MIARAWKDEAFAQELRADPKAALARELGRMQPGVTLPEDLEIRVLEETPTTLYLVIPPKPVAYDGELTDADLDLVSGGSSIPGTSGCAGLDGRSC